MAQQAFEYAAEFALFLIKNAGFHQEWCNCEEDQKEQLINEQGFSDEELKLQLDELKQITTPTKWMMAILRVCDQAEPYHEQNTINISKYQYELQQYLQDLLNQSGGTHYILQAKHGLQLEDSLGRRLQSKVQAIQERQESQASRASEWNKEAANEIQSRDITKANAQHQSERIEPILKEHQHYREITKTLRNEQKEIKKPEKKLIKTTAKERDNQLNTFKKEKMYLQGKAQNLNSSPRDIENRYHRDRQIQNEITGHYKLGQVTSYDHKLYKDSPSIAHKKSIEGVMLLKSWDYLYNDTFHTYKSLGYDGTGGIFESNSLGYGVGKISTSQATTPYGTTTYWHIHYTNKSGRSIRYATTVPKLSASVTKMNRFIATTTKQLKRLNKIETNDAPIRSIASRAKQQMPSILKSIKGYQHQIITDNIVEAQVPKANHAYQKNLNIDNAAVAFKQNRQAQIQTIKQDEASLHREHEINAATVRYQRDIKALDELSLLKGKISTRVKRIKNAETAVENAPNLFKNELTTQITKDKHAYARLQRELAIGSRVSLIPRSTLKKAEAVALYGAIVIGVKNKVLYWNPSPNGMRFHTKYGRYYVDELYTKNSIGVVIGDQNGELELSQVNPWIKSSFQAKEREQEQELTGANEAKYRIKQVANAKATLTAIEKLASANQQAIASKLAPIQKQLRTIEQIRAARELIQTERNMLASTITQWRTIQTDYRNSNKATSSDSKKDRNRGHRFEWQYEEGIRIYRHEDNLHQWHSEGQGSGIIGTFTNSRAWKHQDKKRLAQEDRIINDEMTEYDSIEKEAIKQGVNVYNTSVQMGLSKKQSIKLADLTYFDSLADQDTSLVASSWNDFFINKHARVKDGSEYAVPLIMPTMLHQQIRATKKIISIEKTSNIHWLTKDRIAIARWKANLLHNLNDLAWSNLSSHLGFQPFKRTWHFTKRMTADCVKILDKVAGHVLHWEDDVFDYTIGWSLNKISSLWGGDLGTKVDNTVNTVGHDAEKAVVDQQRVLGYVVSHAFGIFKRVLKDGKTLSKQLIKGIMHPFDWKGHMAALGRDTSGIRHLCKFALKSTAYLYSEEAYLITDGYGKGYKSGGSIWSHGLFATSIHHTDKKMGEVISLIPLMKDKSTIKLAKRCLTFRVQTRNKLHKATGGLIRSTSELIVHRNSYLNQQYQVIEAQLAAIHSAKLSQKFNLMKTDIAKDKNGIQTAMGTTIPAWEQTQKQDAKNLTAKQVDAWSKHQIQKTENEIQRAKSIKKWVAKNHLIKEWPQIHSKIQTDLQSMLHQAKEDQKIIRYDYSAFGRNFIYHAFYKPISWTIPTSHLKKFNQFVYSRELGKKLFASVMIGYAINPSTSKRIHKASVFLDSTRGQHIQKKIPKIKQLNTVIQALNQALTFDAALSGITISSATIQAIKSSQQPLDALCKKATTTKEWNSLDASQQSSAKQWYQYNQTNHDKQHWKNNYKKHSSFAHQIIRQDFKAIQSGQSMTLAEMASSLRPPGWKSMHKINLHPSILNLAGLKISEALLETRNTIASVKHYIDHNEKEIAADKKLLHKAIYMPLSWTFSTSGLKKLNRFISNKKLGDQLILDLTLSCALTNCHNLKVTNFIANCKKLRASIEYTRSALKILIGSDGVLKAYPKSNIVKDAIVRRAQSSYNLMVIRGHSRQIKELTREAHRIQKFKKASQITISANTIKRFQNAKTPLDDLCIKATQLSQWNNLSKKQQKSAEKWYQYNQNNGDKKHWESHYKKNNSGYEHQQLDKDYASIEAGQSMTLGQVIVSLKPGDWLLTPKQPSNHHSASITQPQQINPAKPKQPTAKTLVQNNLSSTQINTIAAFKVTSTTITNAVQFAKPIAMAIANGKKVSLTTLLSSKDAQLIASKLTVNQQIRSINWAVNHSSDKLEKAFSDKMISMANHWTQESNMKHASALHWTLKHDYNWIEDGYPMTIGQIYKSLTYNTSHKDFNRVEILPFYMQSKMVYHLYKILTGKKKIDDKIDDNKKVDNTEETVDTAEENITEEAETNKAEAVETGAEDLEKAEADEAKAMDSFKKDLHNDEVDVENKTEADFQEAETDVESAAEDDMAAVDEAAVNAVNTAETAEAGAEADAIDASLGA